MNKALFFICMFFSAAVFADAGLLRDNLLKMTEGVETSSDGDRYKADFGSMTIRFNASSEPLMSFQRPKVSNGCSGVTLQGGSFSLIKGSKLIENFERIAAEAIEAYAYDIALSTTCETCKKVLDTLEQIERSANAMLSQRCGLYNAMQSQYPANELNTKIMNGAAKAIGDTFSIASDVEAAWEAVDTFAGEVQDATDDNNLSEQGWLWKLAYKENSREAIEKSKACNIMKDVAGLPEEDCIELIANFYGRKVVDRSDPKSKPAVSAPLASNAVAVANHIAGVKTNDADINLLFCNDSVTCDKSKISYKKLDEYISSSSYEENIGNLIKKIDNRYNKSSTLLKSSADIAALSQLSNFDRLMMTLVPNDIFSRLKEIYQSEALIEEFEKALRASAKAGYAHVVGQALAETIKKSEYNFVSIQELEAIKTKQLENKDRAYRDLTGYFRASKIDPTIDSYFDKLRKSLVAEK